MAMAADSSNTNHESPRGGGGGMINTTVNSPNSRQRSLPSAWAQVVRGEPESSPSVNSAAVDAPSSSPPIAAATSASVAPLVQPEASSSADCSASASVPAMSSCASSKGQAESPGDSSSNVATPKKPAWNRPVNGVIEPVSVMVDTVSWPALSESTRSSPKPTADTPRPISDGSTSTPQVSKVAQSPQRQPNANHAVPGRQRSMRHRGGGGNSGNAGGGSGQGVFTRPPPPPPMPPAPFPVFEIPYGNVLPPPMVMDSAVRGPRSMGPQLHAPNDHSSQRNSSRRGNFSPRPRGDGAYHNNRGARRDQDRGDAQVPQYAPPPMAFIPPPPPGTPPYGPLPIRPFPGPMGFDMASPFIYVPTLSPEPFRGVPLVAQGPPSPMYYPVADPNLSTMIVNQIDYYFSDDNLVKDDFLRSNMDNEGWVPISLIANFPRVAQLSSSTQYILESLEASTVVEVQVDKVRRRNDWVKWIPTSARPHSDSASQIAGASVDNSLAASMQTVTLDKATSSENSTADTSSAQTDTDPKISSGESNEQSTLTNGDGNATVEVQASHE